MSTKFNELWVEKYRPTSLEDYIFENKSHKVAFSDFIKDKSIPHLLLTGVAGSGKTSIARIMIDAIGVDSADLMYLNASDENSVDVMRDKIKSFVMSYAIGDAGIKVVLLEEAVQMTPQAQSILLRLMEDYVDDVRFILTGNYENKILPAIKSRCQHFSFKSADRDDITERVASILIKERIDFDLDDLDSYVGVSYPDIRKVINSVQQHIDNGKLIPISETISRTEDYHLNLMGYISKDDWESARKVVCENIANEEIPDMFRFLYTNLHKAKKFTDTETWENGQLEIAEHLYKHTLVADPEINLAALFIKLKQL